MLTLDQLIAEATALPAADKTILLEKLVESMAGQLDQDVLREGIQTAQARLDEIESGAIQTIPPGTLTGLRGIAKRADAIQKMRGLLKTDQPAPSDEEVEAMLEERRVEKYLS
jgi:hypothetical protein